MILSDALDVRLAGEQACLALQTSAQANFYGYGSTTISMSLVGSFETYKYGGGVVTFSGTNLYQATRVMAGVLSATSTNALPYWSLYDNFGGLGRVYVASGATLAVYNSFTDNNVQLLLGAQNFQAGSFIGFDTTSGNRTYANVIANLSGTYSGVGMLGITKLGPNTLTLSAASTYTGATKVLAGTLATSTAERIPNASAVEISSGATLTLGGAETIASLAGAGTMTCGANVLTISGANTTIFSGTLTAGSNIFKSGTGAQTLSGSSTVAGSISLQTGTVTLSGTFTQTLAGNAPRNTQLAGNALASVLKLNSSGSTTFTGLMFGENNGGTSTINVSAGTLTISGQTWMAGVLSTLNITGGSITSASWDIGGGAGTTTSIVNQSAGTFTCSGTLRWGVGSGSATSVYNLDGGICRTGGWVRNGGTNTFNFNGGTFNPVSIQTITQPLISCLIKAGGAIFGNTAILVWDTVLANASGVTGNLTMTGSSTLILSQANTYSGSTTISSGTLQIGNSGTTGSVSASSGITNNSSLVFARSNTLTQGTDFPAISGSGSVMQAGSGTTILSSANTYAGNTTIAAGNLRLSHSSAFGTLGEIRFLGGTLQYGAGISTDISARIRNNASTMRVDTNAQSVSFASLGSTNSGGLIKSGTGTLTLTGASNTFTGALIVSGGELAFSGSYTAVSSVAVNGTTPTLTLTGTFTQTYTGSGVRSFQIAVNAGTSGTANIGAGANVTLNGGLMLGDNNGGNGTLNVTGGTIATASNVGSWLAGASCLLNVSGGTFTTGSLEPGGGTGAAVVTVSGSGTINAGGININRGNSAGVSTVINLNGGTLTATSVTHLTVAQPATWNFNGGTFTPQNTLGLPSTITTVVKAGGALLNVTGAYLLTIPSALTTDGGGGGLTKSGTGSLTLSGATTYTGATSILAGTLTKSFSSGALSNAVFTNTTLTANFNAVPVNGATYQIFAGATTQSYASVTVTGAPGVVCSYTSATSTLTVVSGGIAISTVLAGSGVRGTIDGTGTAAQFYNPMGLVVG